MNTVIKLPKAKERTPEQHALWVKYDRLAIQIEGLSRQAQLIALAATGVDDTDDEMASISNAAFALRDCLRAIAEEVRL